MAENRVPYIIELTVNDKDLRTRMSKLNWEEILGASKGKSFKQVLKKDTEAAAQEIRTTLGGIGIDWGQILGVKDFELLEKKIAKIITANTEKLKVFGREGDTTGIQNTIDLVAALGNELKSLGSGFDAASLVRNMGAFMKVLTPLSAKIDQLAKEPEKVSAAFDRLFNSNVSNGVVKVSQGFTVIGDEVSKAATKTNQAIQEMEKSLSSIDVLFNKEYSIKFNSDLEKQFESVSDEITKVEHDISELEERLDTMSSSDKKFTSTRNQLVQKYVKQSELYRQLDLIDKQYVSKYSKDDSLLTKYNLLPNEVINEAKEQIKTFINDTRLQLKDISKSTKTTTDGINIPIKLPTQDDLIKTINQYVDGINQSKAIHTIKINLDDTANIIEDKQRRAYKDNPEDDDVNTTKLVEQTEKRFDRIATAIEGKQGKILDNTKTWRNNMLEQFKFKSGDFDFKFNDTLIESLQSLFDDYTLKINIDPQYLADQVKTVLDSSGGSIGGGTASIDANSMASAIAMGLKSVLTGEVPQTPTSSDSVDGGSSLPEEVSHIVKEIEQTGKHLDLAEDYVKDVVDKLKAVAKYASKDSKGSIATRSRFDALGIDLREVKNAADVGNDAKIVSIIEKSLLQINEFGNLTGSTVIDELSKFKGSSSKTISAFLASMNEVFYMLQANTQTVEEWTRQRNDKEIFDSAREKAKATSSLRDVRAPIRQGNIPNVESIETAISLMSAIGQNTDDLQVLKSAREALGNKTDDASIEEFKTAADTFYKSSTKTFWDLKKQTEDLFKGTVYFQGKNGKTSSKHIDSYKQLANIKDDAVIVDVQVSSSLNNVALGTVKSKYKNRISEAEEKRLMRGATQPDFIVPREYEKDILNKELTYKEFKPQGVPTGVNLDATLEANEKRKESLILDIQAKEEEKKLLDTEISILDKKIEDLTAKHKSISQKRRDTAKLKVSDLETTQQQLSSEIFMLEGKVGNGKTGTEQIIGSLTQEIEAQLAKRASAEEQLAQLSEMDVEQRKKSLGIKISELEKELPDLQNNLIQAQERHKIAESDRVIAQADVFKASAALKAIPNTKKNNETRGEAKKVLTQANFKLSQAENQVNNAAKDIDDVISDIERNEKQILNLKNQMSQTTLDSIRQEQLNRIRAIDDVITSLENELESSIKQKNAKETMLTKINKELKSAKNAIPLRTEQELESAIADRDKLSSQKTLTDKTIQGNQGTIDSIEQMNKRLTAEKEYNKLLEKSSMLQGTIKKMEEDGADAEALQKKQKELDKINVKLNKAKANVEALGGFFGQGNTKEYSDSERKTYALEQLKLIENDLITARAQKRVSESRISKKDKEIADLDRWGLGAGIGASELGKTKGALTSEFMGSDYVQSQVNALREKTKVAIATAENESRKIFDKKVAMAMEHLNWNPLDQTQVQKFLNTTHGQQLSSDFESEVDTNTTNIWKQYDVFRKDLLDKLKTEFQDSFKTDKGVLSATFKTQDETGQWINEIVEVRVKEALRARLEAEKGILKEKHAPIQGNIDRLEADKIAAIEYGGVSDKELLSEDIVKDQIRKEEKLSELQEKQRLAKERLDDLDKKKIVHSDESYKVAKREFNEVTKQVKWYELLVKNRQKLIQMRYDESKESTYTDEEKELHFTNQIVSYHQKIEDSLARQKALKERISTATRDEKTKLKRQLAIEEDKVSKWNEKIPVYANKLTRLKASKSQDSTSGVAPEGGIVGNLLAAMREAVGEGVQLDTTDLAKDSTLREIISILGNGVPTYNSDTQPIDNTDYNKKKARIAELEVKENTVVETSGQKKVKFPKEMEESAKALYKTWNVKSNELEFETVKQKAIELKQVIDTLYDAGKADTQEFINAQTELSKLLSGWRNKIGKSTNPEMFSKDGSKEGLNNWQTYLTSGDTKFFDNLDNVQLSSISQKDYISRSKKVYKESQPSTSTDSGTKNALTRAERKELKTLRAEVKEYEASGNTNASHQRTAQPIETFISDESLQELINLLLNSQQGDTSSQGQGDKSAGTLAQYTKMIEQAQTNKYLMTDDVKVSEFNNIKASINDILTSVANGEPLTDQLKQKLTELNTQAINTGESIKKTINQNKRLYVGSNEVDSAKKQYDRIMGTANLGGISFDSDATDNPKVVQDYISAYNELNAAYDRYVKQGEIHDPKKQEALRQQAASVQALGKRLMSSVTQAEKLQQLVSQSGTFTDSKTGEVRNLGGSRNVIGADTTNLEPLMRNFVHNDLKQANIEGAKFDAVNQRLIYTFRTSKNTVADMVVQYNEAEQALYAYQKQERESLTGFPALMNNLKSKMKSIMQYTASITSIYRVWGEIKQGIQYVKEIDAALTELKKVTDETEETYDRFLDTAAKTADKVGSTIKNVISSTADWARLGYTIQDATQLAESTQVLMNVSEFTDISTATDSLISSIQAFKYTAEESMDVVDILNTIGNNYAISTADLAQSLTKSSGSLVAANGTLEEAVALTATANTIIQDADVVGTALKTVAMRLRGTSTEEMEEEGIDTDGAVTSKSKLQSKIKGLSGVDILTDTGAYKSTYQILSEISDVWEDINDMDQAALLELLAGKRAGSVMSAILQNPETLKDAFESASDASGSALKENEKYLDSIQGKIDLFNNAMQTMWSNTLDSEFIKGFVSLGTELVKIIDKIGLIESLLIALSGYSMIKGKMGPITFFKELISLIPKSVKGIQSWILGMETASAATSTLSTTTTILTQAQLKEKLMSQGLTDVVAEEIIAKTGLGKTTDALSAKTLDATLKKMGYSKAQRESIVQSVLDTKTTQANTAANVTNAASSVAAGEAEDKDTQDTLENIAATTTDTATTGVNTAVNGANTVSNITKGGKVVDTAKTASTAATVGGTAASAGGALTSLAAAVPYILGAIAAIAAIVIVIETIHVSAKEASEQLKETKNSVDSLESEIDSLNSELDDTRDKIAELEALPSLSLVQQEELEKLERQNELLERQLALKERQLAIEEAKLIDDTETAIEKNWTESGAWDLTNEGAIQEDKWYTWGESGKDVINKAIDRYQKNTDAIRKGEDLLLNWGDDDSKQVKSSELIGLGVQTNYGGYIDKSSVEAAVKQLDEENVKIASSIEEFFNNPNWAGLSYGMSDEIDVFLDEYNQAQLRWEKTLYGDTGKASAIKSLFGSDATDELKNLKKEIDEIMAGDGDWDSKNSAIQALIPTEEGVEGYKQLDFVMRELGVTTQDIADYFTVLNGEFNSSTFEGVLRQYQTGVDVLNELKEAGISETNWDDSFFTKDDEGNFKARADKFGEILEGMDEDAREAFLDIAESVKNGEKSWDQAITSMTMSGVIASTKILEQQWAEVNKNIFKSLDDGAISGWIDTFSELGAALEDVASSMDLLHTAQQQMNNSGRISIKTALELIESTDNWEKVLTITEGTIKLTSDAEDQLVQSKLNVIKAQVDEALSAVELQLELLGSADSAYTAAVAADVSDEAYEQYTNAMNSYTAAIAAFGAALDGIRNGDSLSTIMSNMGSAYDTAKKIANSSSDTTRISRADLEQKQRDLQAKQNILKQGGTVSSFKNNYDFDKYPGDKYDEGADDAFAKAMDYWENRIAANQARYEQIQNEIDLIESQGGIAGEEYYQEQIKLENERLKLLEAQKAEAQRFLGTFKEGSEEWWEVANTLNDIEGEIDDVTASIQDLSDAMAEVDWKVFDETHERFGTLIDDLETIRDLIAPNGEEDWFDDEGKWTEDGVAVLGSYVQQLEMYKNSLDEVNKKLKEYSRPYEGNESYYKELGIDSEQEYYDAVTKLQDQQQEYLKGVSDTEQAVVDMYEAQIDAIEEYTSELVEHYTEYIDLVKEALDAERELYEFKKDVEKQTKDIASLERRIASLSGSDNAADIAERRKLEAELYEAREGLNDTYYDHAMNSQQNALDEEGAAYEESMNNYIEKLRTTLEEATLNMDLFMEAVTASVMLNADTVSNKYNETGVAMSGYLTKPWLDAAQAVKNFEGDALAQMNTWTTEEGFFGKFKTNATGQLTSPWKAGTNAAKTFKSDVATQMDEVVKNIKSNVSSASTQLSKLYKQIEDTEKKAASAKTTPNSSNSGNYNSGNTNTTPKNTTTKTTEPTIQSVYGVTPSEVIALGYGPLGITGFEAKLKNYEIGLYMSGGDPKVRKASASEKMRKNLSDMPRAISGPAAIRKHAKGTLGTKQDEWAITDESWIGEEITLAAGKHGQLQYLKKGSAVMPADISANLIEWGKLDPSSITMPGVGSVLNMINNSVMQPNYEFNFDSLVHVDHCDEGTLKNLEKMVDTKLNDFGKRLNYSVKKFAR